MARSHRGTWGKGIGGVEVLPNHLKVEDVKPINKRESVETNTQLSGFPSLIKVEERSDSSRRQEKKRHTVPLPSRVTSAPRSSNSQSQPSEMHSATGPENCTNEGMDILPHAAEDSAVTFDIEPEERRLLLRIPLELFFPPPPPEHCSNERFRWKCPIRGCAAVLDSASNYMDLFPGFSEIEAEWLPRRPESLDSEMGRLFIHHIQCRHYEFHLKDSGVDLVDVGLFYLSRQSPDVDAPAGKTRLSRLEYFIFVIFVTCSIYGFSGFRWYPSACPSLAHFHIISLHRIYVSNKRLRPF